VVVCVCVHMRLYFFFMQKLFRIGKPRSAKSCKAAGFWRFYLTIPSKRCALGWAVSTAKAERAQHPEPTRLCPQGPRTSSVLCVRARGMLWTSTPWKGRVCQLRAARSPERLPERQGFLRLYNAVPEDWGRPVSGEKRHPLRLSACKPGQGVPSLGCCGWERS